MKKFLLVLLILAAAGSLFAQELKFSGEVVGGITVPVTDAEKDELKIASFVTSSDYTGGFNLNGTYINADGNAGINFGLRSRYTNTDASMDESSSSTFADSAYAWLKVLDNKITFYGGKLDADDGFEFDVSADTGFYTRIEPIPGARLGFGIYPKRNYANPVELKWGVYRAGAAYTVPDVVSFLGSFAYDRGTLPKDAVNASYTWTVATQADVTAGTKDAIDNTLVTEGQGYWKETTPAAKAEDGYMLAKAALKINILALKPLGFSGLSVKAAVEDIAGVRKPETSTVSSHHNEGMNLKIEEEVTFAAGDLEVGGIFKQSFLFGKRATDDAYGKDYYSPDLTFFIYGQYKLNGGTIVPRVEGWFNMGSSPAFGWSSKNEPELKKRGGAGIYRSGTDGIPKEQYLKNMDGNDGFVGNAGVTPSVAFKIGGGAITVGDKLMFDLTDYAKAQDGLPSLYNSFFIEYKVGF